MHGNKDIRVPWGGGNVTGDRGISRSAEETRNYFILVNNATTTPVETILPDLDATDNCRIVAQYYSHPTTPVLFYRLDGGGHFIAAPDLPGYAANCGFEASMGNFCYDADGTQLIWDFLTQF
jgi:poly(3-hydroxybutyrate) depolymerase